MVRVARFTWFLVAGVLLGCVLAYFVFARAQMPDCATNRNAALCYTSYLEGVLEQQGVVAALESLSTIYQNDIQFRRYCHGNVHDIGKAAYTIFQETGDIEITELASYCGFGYYHGFIEEMLTQTGSLNQSKDFCRRVGEKMKDMQPYAEGACYHGIGHGVTDGTDPALWGDPIALTSPGLTLCRDISETNEWLMRCSSGVFNSLALMYNDDTYALKKPENPYEICSHVELQAPERESCYSQMNTVVALLADHDAVKALSYTRFINDPKLKRVAIVSIAAMPEQWRRSGEKASIAICRSLDSEFTTACYRGVVSGMMEFGTPGKEEQRAFEYCSDSRLGAHEKSECMAEVISMSRGMFPEMKVRDICLRIPKESRPLACDNLAGV